MRSNSDLLRRGLRHPDVFVASARHHTNRVIGRPIRTAVVVVFTYVMVVALATFTNSPDETREVLQSDVTVSSITPLLPPTYVLLVIAGAAIVGVPIGMVLNGIRRDLRSSRRRRMRRES